MQQPEMMLIASIKKVKTLKSPEECSPCSANWRPTSTHRRSILVLKTDEPHIKEALSSPRKMIIRIETSLFSPPRSPRTLDGTPCSRIASINMSKTVDARLFVLAHKPVTCIQESEDMSSHWAKNL
jgi:hypothetical protein